MLNKEVCQECFRKAGFLLSEEEWTMSILVCPTPCKYPVQFYYAKGKEIPNHCKYRLEHILKKDESKC